MKILMALLGCIVGLVLLVIVIGSLLPRAHTASRAAAFRSTPEQLFILIEGPQSWRSNVKKYELLSDNGGHRQWRETGEHGEAITYEVVDRQPPRLLKTRIATRGLPYSGSWTFTLDQRAGLTVVRITEEGEVHNPISRFVARFIVGHARTIETYLRDLGKATGQEVEVR